MITRVLIMKFSEFKIFSFILAITLSCSSIYANETVKSLYSTKAFLNICVSSRGNPELINKQAKNMGFIQMPNEYAAHVLKDYNGQTYWLSANIHSFAKASKIPKWLNLAVGYGAEGMITAIPVENDERYRQFYLSLDVDLSKIKTKSPFLSTLFSIFNSVKIPAPTFEINSLGKSKFYILYF